MHKLVKISGIVKRQAWTHLITSYAAHSIFWARRIQDGVQINIIIDHSYLRCTTRNRYWSTTFPSLHKRPTRQPIRKCTALCRWLHLYTPIRTQNDSSLLQNDLHKLQKWQDTWLMKFNPDKCYTMTLATRTPTSNMYTLILWTNIDICRFTLLSRHSHIKYT